MSGEEQNESEDTLELVPEESNQNASSFMAGSEVRSQNNTATVPFTSMLSCSKDDSLQRSAITGNPTNMSNVMKVVCSIPGVVLGDNFWIESKVA